MPGDTNQNITIIEIIEIIIFQVGLQKVSVFLEVSLMKKMAHWG